MKIFKMTTVISGIVFLLLSIICFISTFSYDIDAYDFGNIYKALNPAKVFLLFSIAVFVYNLVLQRLNRDNINIEKCFFALVIIIYFCFGSAYLSSMNYNNALFERTVNAEFGHERKAKYLPYYDEFSDLPTEKGEYEIFKGDSNNTVMLYVDSDIINSQGKMYYEMEYLDTNSFLIKYKYIADRMYINPSYIIQNGNKQVITVNKIELEIYEYNSDYAVYINDNGNVFYATLVNAINISPDDFAQKCTEQLSLMKETVDKGALLIRE